ncbi:MAG: hypothetical protein OXP66_11770 [Candidatus Tectomicrobia bacterium]|nr:hypothetical protein [Candidatus Tectomicrobia bacterium]
MHCRVSRSRRPACRVTRLAGRRGSRHGCIRRRRRRVIRILVGTGVSHHAGDRTRCVIRRHLRRIRCRVSRSPGIRKSLSFRRSRLGRNPGGLFLGRNPGSFFLGRNPGSFFLGRNPGSFFLGRNPGSLCRCRIGVRLGLPHHAGVHFGIVMSVVSLRPLGFRSGLVHLSTFEIARIRCRRGRGARRLGRRGGCHGVGCRVSRLRVRGHVVTRVVFDGLDILRRVFG